MKDIKNELGLDDVEDGDLVNMDDDDELSTKEEEIIAHWCWERANYFMNENEKFYDNGKSDRFYRSLSFLNYLDYFSLIKSILVYLVS